jgi:putative transposase
MRESGHLWQGRYFSCVLDDPHMWACVRYVERNPMRAGVVERAEDWPWSSAAAHCGRRADPLLSPVQMPWPVPDGSAYLAEEEDADVATIRRQTATGRPCGSRAVRRAVGVRPVPLPGPQENRPKTKEKKWVSTSLS